MRMKMSRKMILVFFIMILLIVAISTYLLIRTNIEHTESAAEERFRNMAENMVQNVEHYVDMMDLAIEELTSDASFMEAFYQLSVHGDDNPIAAQVWQNKMSNTLYHSPAADNFYRVSIFARNGYYLSNHIDRNDSIISLSEEAQELIASIPYLRAAECAPYQRFIIGPHADHFTLARQVNVFSAIRSVSLHGRVMGFIEVSASVEALHNLFITDNDTVMVRAVFQDGNVLYASAADKAVYEGVPLAQLTDYTDPSGLRRQVFHAQSRWLGLDIYLAQDAAIRMQSLVSLLWLYLRFSIFIAAAALVLVVVISVQLTRSIRLLTEKVHALPVDRLLNRNNPPSLDTFVTSAGDDEIHELEKNFNTLMQNLQSSAQNEMAMRESTLTARLNALQAQMNPHFVYNTLNIISAKGMESGNEDVVELCDQFAQMLRYSTDTRSTTATLLEDLTHVRSYLTLLKARYEDGLQYTIHVPDEMNGIRVPRLLLQPLVENAIVHGFDDGAQFRRIEIGGLVENNEMILEIRDNGQGFDPEVLTQLQQAIDRIHRTGEAPEANGHIGLLNTCWRLYYYSKGAIFMQLANDCGAVVRLRMPLISSVG